MSSQSFATAVNGQRILFLDLEGVMTKGMFDTNASGEFLRRRSVVYSEAATMFVRKLVNRHGFKIVLITRHHQSDFDLLEDRLKYAGIRHEWLYAEAPSAMAMPTQQKGDAMMDWLKGRPYISMENTVAVDDFGIQTSRGRTPYPPERVVQPDSDHGLQDRDYEQVLKLVGDAPIVSASTGTPRQKQQGPQGL